MLKTAVEGYASLFNIPDESGDRVLRGAFQDGLKALSRPLPMLYHHDPKDVIGIWTDIMETAIGLYVKGHFITDVRRAADVSALVEGNALNGLSIGYKTRIATKNRYGGRNLLKVELWEVSLVTFPMLQSARLKLSGRESISPAHRLLNHLQKETARTLTTKGTHHARTTPPRNQSLHP